MNNNKEISEYTDAKAQNNEINLQTDTTLTKKWSSKEDLLLIKLIKSSSMHSVGIAWKHVMKHFVKDHVFNKIKWNSKVIESTRYRDGLSFFTVASEFNA